ncbi:SCO family protein [Turneriella parva]|uniref:Electron transport protein SCO1/SenC n=1 Tax=Turneriella parva (strain ATCC BAA-1111 / DSM 21527 / NCTC 11395 / H) TaxID=869212 RepID=I4B374_TURPD|nr:SCO family protein [Turneriella parva]AFM11731.1 electron transport protein SCO1/SenC [Turneriella parva DSM 21527]
MKLCGVVLQSFAVVLMSLSLACKANPPGDADITAYYEPVAGVLPYFKGKFMTPWWPAKNAPAAALPADLKAMPSMGFTTHENKPLATSSLRGKFVLVNFYFTSCHGICPMLTANMRSLLQLIKKQDDLQIISVSVDPAKDTPDVIKAFRAKYAIKSDNWIFLTGPQDDVFRMARTAFNADTFTKDINRDLRDFLHTENFYLLDKDSYLRGVYRAKGMGDLGRLITELETLRGEP